MCGTLSRSAVAWVLAIGLCTSGLFASGDAPLESRPAARFDLLSQVRAGAVRTPEQLLNGLRIAGPEAVSRLVEQVSLAGSENDNITIDPKYLKIINILLDKLPKFALDTIRAHDANVDSYQSIALVAFAVLERAGASAEHLACAVQILNWQDAKIPKDAAIITAFERAGAAILTKNRSHYSYVRECLEKAPLAVKLGFMGALGQAGTFEGTQILCDALGRTPDFDRLILQQIGKKTGPLPVRIDDRNFDIIRRYLESNDPQICREAALTAGRLEDAGSIPVLLELLISDNISIRENAYWALRQITGLKFRLDKKRWSRWFDGEQAWWAARGERLVTELETADKTERVAMITEFAGRRLHRKELTNALVQVLDGDLDSETLRVVFAAIHTLGSPNAVPPLVAKLDSENVGLRASVLATLMALTGENLGSEKASWEIRFQ